MFQQDSDPNPMAKLARAWFEDNNIEVKKWERQSQDMNPQENFREILKKPIRETRPENLSEDKLFVKEDWTNNPIKICQAHVGKYRHRLLGLFNNKAGLQSNTT